MASYRNQKLQPWYHQTRERCDATTKYNDEQCVNSAKYAGTGINSRVRLCKIHADMADFPVKLIVEKRIDLRAIPSVRHIAQPARIPFSNGGSA